jgi:23S rRNA (uracil1939-C5)-methyltransferase
MQRCAVLDPALVALLPPLRELMRELIDDRQNADLLVTRTDSGPDLLIGRVPPLDRAQRETVAAFAAAQDLARVAWRRASETPETLVQRRVPHVRFGDVPVDIPPGAFLQASASGEAAIVAVVRSGVAGAKRVADLFAGCGTLSFPLAAQARVHAVEGAKNLAAALAAAANRSQSTRITVETRDLNRRPLLADELGPFDAVVFDPPRDGAATQAAQIARSRIAKVVGVSCNSATFARDARILVDAGFRLGRVTPIDQFLWSPHLELVGTFER